MDKHSPKWRHHFPTGRLENDAAIDGIVNLAGESLFAGRWTERRKKTLFASRVGVTEGVVGLVSRLDRKPAVLVSGSAVGFYGNVYMVS